MFQVKAQGTGSCYPAEKNGLAMSALHIALYGKGGVGTSTTAANISVALAETGHRVLQVGFDVSHDSTWVLRGDRAIRTILDAVRETGDAATA
jgi:nitrogenase iron protein NifH